MVHDVHNWPEWTWFAGSAELNRIEPDTGLILAAADPRRTAAVAPNVLNRSSSLMPW